jgi:hypothetical protein
MFKYALGCFFAPRLYGVIIRYVVPFLDLLIPRTVKNLGLLSFCHLATSVQPVMATITRPHAHTVVSFQSTAFPMYQLIAVCCHRGGTFVTHAVWMAFE